MGAINRPRTTKKTLFWCGKTLLLRKWEKWNLKRQSWQAIEIACRDILILTWFLTVVLIAQNLRRYWVRKSANISVWGNEMYQGLILILRVMNVTFVTRTTFSFKWASIVANLRVRLRIHENCEQIKWQKQQNTLGEGRGKCKTFATKSEDGKGPLLWNNLLIMLRFSSQ